MSIGSEIFTPRSGRQAPAIGDRVRVYRNLPLFKHQVFSILAMDGPNKGLVLGYCRVVGLKRVTFKVSEATRLKVVSKNCRTVHAFAEGYVESLSRELPDDCQGEDVERLTYNPFFGRVLLQPAFTEQTGASRSQHLHLGRRLNLPCA